MIVDSSAVIAILLQEPGADEILEKVGARHCRIGAPTLVEIGIVLANRLRGDVAKTVAGFIDAFEIEVIPFSDVHLPIAIAALERFGKGRHPAALNFGHCMTYAVAKVADEELLFKGDDFGQTDLAAA